MVLDKNKFLSDLDEKLEIYQNENLAMANQVNLVGEALTAHGILVTKHVSRLKSK